MPKRNRFVLVTLVLGTVAARSTNVMYPGTRPSSDEVSSAALPSQSTCGKVQVVRDRILNGEQTLLGDWPWMVAVGYKTENSDKLTWSCGGTLITNRHVITAATCVVNTSRLKPHVVRLGDLDLDPDASDGAAPLDVPIQRVTAHERYFHDKKIVNDIAILELKNNVTYTEFVQPICLPISRETKTVDLVNKTSIVTGWGSVRREPDEMCKAIAGTDDAYTCRPIDRCPSASRAAEDVAAYPKICRFRGRTPIVCCPSPRGGGGAKAAQMCGEYRSLTTGGGGTIDVDGCRARRTAAGAENGRLVSIVGGTEAAVSEFPHMVILGFGEHVENVQWSCGGSLISDRYVLSAAHCSEIGTKRDRVRWALLGDNDLATGDGPADPQLREIDRRVLHPDYDRTSVYDDIGLYRLKTPVRFSRFVLPVCISAADTAADRAVAIGWGRTGAASRTSNVLMKVSLDIVGQNECNRSYSSAAGTRLAFGIDPRGQICAGRTEGGKDTCQGDSGGPLLTVHPEFECTYTQVGITSFGRLCGEPDAPGVYTRVSNYVAWIETVVWPSA